MHRIGFVLLSAALCGCGDGAQLTPPRQAAEQPEASAQYDATRLPTFDVDKLPSLGGAARGNSINDRDWVAGFSNLPGDQSRHATLWRDRSIVDLGTLGGPNSNVQWPGQNDRGTVVGIAETEKLDSLHESWSCSAFFPTLTGHVCRGFVWEGGSMRALPTLGGTHGFATGVNDEGQIVGWAETKVHDPTCNAPQVLQFRAVVWDARSGEARELRPLQGDSTSAATAINERGQAVGISGACDVAVGEFSAAHAVLWEHGHVTDIGNLGGIAWNTPMAINEAGDVVGFSDLAGDVGGAFNAHAFLWTRKGGIEDLETLPGDETSQAMGINSRRQVVGVSCGETACRPFLWQLGVMYDLDSLVGPGFKDKLVSAQHINEDGEITGQMIDASTGKKVAYVATPRIRRQ